LALSYISLIFPDPDDRARAIAKHRIISVVASIPALGSKTNQLNRNLVKIKRTNTFPKLPFVVSVSAVIFSIPQLAFYMGEYEVNAYTYPAFTMFILYGISVIGVVGFLKSPEKQETSARDGKFYTSVGSLLVLLLCFYQGYLVGTFEYMIAVVMIEVFLWEVWQYALILLLLGFIGVGAVFIARLIATRFSRLIPMTIVPILGYITFTCVCSLIGTMGAGKIPDYVTIPFFIFGMETMFGAFHIMQTMLGVIFANIIPRQYLVRCFIESTVRV
jgi:hypothetical protein